MKRSTLLKELKDAYSEKYNIRDEEKHKCRFLYYGKQIYDNATLDSFGIDDGDVIDFFWEQVGGEKCGKGGRRL